MTKTKEQLESLLQEARCNLLFAQGLYENTFYEEDYACFAWWQDEVRYLEDELEMMND